MVTTLRPNIGEPFNIDGVPPGAGAVEFQSSAMWDGVNRFKEQNSPIMGREVVDRQITESFLKGLGLDENVAGLDKRIERDAAAKAVDLATRDIKNELSGRISGVTDDGKEVGQASSASIASAQQMQNPTPNFGGNQ